MSDFHGHLRGGLVAGGVFSCVLLIIQLFLKPLAWLELPLLPIFCLFGAFWPDSDIGSKSQTVVYTFFVILDIILIFLLKYYREAAILGLFAMLPAVSKHRGWTHNPIWAIVVGLPLLVPPMILGEAFLLDLKVYMYRNLIYFGVPYFLAFECGVFSHLLLDKLGYFKRKRAKLSTRTASTQTSISPGTRSKTNTGQKKETTPASSGKPAEKSTQKKKGTNIKNGKENKGK